MYSSSPASAPLLVSDDRLLVDQSQRLAAAADTTLVVTSPTAGPWATAPLVLVGADAVGALVRTDLPRGADLVVVCRGVPDGELFRAALDLGAASLVELPQGGDELLDLLADCVDGPHSPARVIGVVGGCGGVGASVLAAALALSAEGRRLLVDLDPLGAGQLRACGLEDVAGAAWHDLEASRGRFAARAVRDGVPGRDGLGVLGFSATDVAAPSRQLVREVVEAARRGHDTVVLDLPRDLGRAFPTGLLDHLLVVVRADPPGVVAASRRLGALGEVGVAPALVVRSRRGDPIAEEVARALGLPLAGQVPDHRRLGEHLVLGLGPVHGRRNPVAAGARSVLEVCR